MEELVTLMYNIARIVIVVAGSGAAIAVAVAGLLYIFAAGEPQKQRTARDAFIGAIVGMLICGAAFIIPRVISNFVLAPSGGETLVSTASLSCDGQLRNALVVEQQASTKDRMQTVVSLIQARNKEECHSDVWNPKVDDSPGAPCDSTTIAGFKLPKTMVVSSAPRVNKRDSSGNIMVGFGTDRPSDGAKCWIYLVRSGSWHAGL